MAEAISIKLKARESFHDCDSIISQHFMGHSI